MLNRSSCCSEFLSSIFSGWYPESDAEQHSSSEFSEPSTSTGITVVCDSLYALHRPEGTPSMQVLFFHGLQLGEDKDAHVITWESADGQCIWPKTWLADDFPNAHIYCVWYSGHVVRKSHQSNESDMFLIGENLLSDFVQHGIGQETNCPVILVGHSFGGLVIKEVCNQAFAGLKSTHNEAKHRDFLDNVKGIFYYATPHHGSNAMAELAGSPLFQYYKILSSHTERLNMQFDQLCRIHQTWRIRGLGETLPTQWRDGHGRVRNVLIVEEASARVENFYTVRDVDHFSICKPQSKESASFHQLKLFLSHIATDMEEKPANLEDLPEFIVGIDFTVQDVINKLVSKRPIGLVGMGGLGKTTLAQAVFNTLIRQFEFSCFVSNVKGIEGELYHVKERAWTRMYRHGKRIASELDWNVLTGKKLLLVLDDISDERDVKVLSNIAKSVHADSRFILTSRDRPLIGRQGDVYEVPFLNEVSSIKLFTSCAFPSPENPPPPELASIKESIVKKCSGLPLTLEVIGSYLRENTLYDQWKQTLDALNKAEEVSGLNEQIWSKLRISYDRLTAKEQQVFLDATTFFSSNTHWTLCEAKAAWSTAYNTPSARLLWKTLVDRSLVYEVKEDEIIKVHDQLQSLGRKIASEVEYNDNCRVWEREVGSQYNDKCRVWEAEVASQILQTTQMPSTKEIHALRMEFSPHRYGDINLPITACHKLKKTCFLELHNRVVIDGATPETMDRAKGDGSFPTEFVLLKCGGDQLLLDNALQRRLTVLKVSVLEYLPDSLENLSCLAYLQIQWSPLSILPDSFGKMRSLKDLKIEFCNSLRTLPESFGQLEKLERLKFGQVSIESLPESFGHLSSLNHLTFWRCPLQTFPESFGGLSSLNHLDFFQCQGFKTLPESFGRLAKLKFLKFKQSGIRTLPDSFGELEALEHLEFDMCGPEDILPESFWQLKKLRRLIFCMCWPVKSLPENFGQLKALERLEINGCHALNNLPESFGQLKTLRYLQLYDCPIKSLPESFWELSDLNHLELNCPKLEVLSESFGSLTGLQSLTITVYTESIPNSLGNLENLATLKIYLHSAASIPDSIKSLKSLQTLEIRLDPGFDNLLPSWLVPNASRDYKSYSSIEFQVEKGCFSVIGSVLR